MRRGALAALGILTVAIVGVRLWQDRPQERPIVVDSRPPPRATEFEIRVDSGQCNPPQSPVDRVEIEESGGEVTVTAYVDPFGGLIPPRELEECLDYFPATVKLDRPLGDRSLIDGSTEATATSAFR